MCNVVSRVALPISKSLFVKAVAAELSETLSVFLPAKSVRLSIFFFWFPVIFSSGSGIGIQG